MSEDRQDAAEGEDIALAPETIFRNPRFDALRIALYHTERCNFLDRVNKVINSLVILLSAGVVGKAASHFALDGLWIELSVLIVATIQLVFDFGGRAKEHQFLQKRYYEILAEMEAAPQWDGEFLKKWSAKLLSLSADEFLTMRALDAIAYNKALGGVTDDPEQLRRYRLRVTVWQSLLRNLLAFNWADFKPQSR